MQPRTRSSPAPDHAGTLILICQPPILLVFYISISVISKTSKQKKWNTRARGSKHLEGSQRRGVAVFGQIYQRTLSVWTTETMDFLKLKWPGRTVSVGGMQGWWEGCPESYRIMDDAQCTGSVFQRFSSQML